MYEVENSTSNRNLLLTMADNQLAVIDKNLQDNFSFRGETVTIHPIKVESYFSTKCKMLTQIVETKWSTHIWNNIYERCMFNTSVPNITLLRSEASQINSCENSKHR